jgi:hypothetical protein
LAACQEDQKKKGFGEEDEAKPVNSDALKRLRPTT